MQLCKVLELILSVACTDVVAANGQQCENHVMWQCDELMSSSAPVLTAIVPLPRRGRGHHPPTQCVGVLRAGCAVFPGVCLRRQSQSPAWKDYGQVRCACQDDVSPLNSIACVCPAHKLRAS